ncbi:MAG: hypothetical protein J6W82_04115, partial [Bacteroidales bacterium]|nr:hypothetical protein [Bacteroidales bacterium]
RNAGFLLFLAGNSNQRQQGGQQEVQNFFHNGEILKLSLQVSDFRRISQDLKPKIFRGAKRRRRHQPPWRS